MIGEGAFGNPPSPPQFFYASTVAWKCTFRFDPFDLQLKGWRNWGFLHEQEILQYGVVASCSHSA